MFPEQESAEEGGGSHVRPLPTSLHRVSQVWNILYPVFCISTECRSVLGVSIRHQTLNVGCMGETSGVRQNDSQVFLQHPATIQPTNKPTESNYDGGGDDGARNHSNHPRGLVTGCQRGEAAVMHIRILIEYARKQSGAFLSKEKCWAAKTNQENVQSLQVSDLWPFILNTRLLMHRKGRGSRICPT